MCVPGPVRAHNVSGAYNATDTVKADNRVDEIAGIDGSKRCIEDDEGLIDVAKQLPNPAAALLVTARLITVSVCAMKKIGVEMCVTGPRELGWPKASSGNGTV